MASSISSCFAKFKKNCINTGIVLYLGWHSIGNKILKVTKPVYSGHKLRDIATLIEGIISRNYANFSCNLQTATTL